MYWLNAQHVPAPTDHQMYLENSWRIHKERIVDMGLRGFEFDEKSMMYVGRRTKNMPASVLANHYSISRYGEERAVLMFRKDLSRKIEARDARVLTKLGEIWKYGLKLACHNSSGYCHSMIILNAVNYCSSRPEFERYFQ